MIESHAKMMEDEKKEMMKGMMSEMYENDGG
jgi:hypothetical protein